MQHTKAFSFQVRVYYEDTDAAGIVYYANYLKFAERARTEWLRAVGFEQEKLRAEQGLGFVVAHLEADYKLPARLDDLITIETSLQQHSKVHMTMRQILKKGDATLVILSVKIACVDKNGKPVRIPEQLLHALAK
ncbi:MAG: tol-pal system-associated acyl-CoA thioesterase [Rickettsiales bacterium]